MNPRAILSVVRSTLRRDIFEALDGRAMAIVLLAGSLVEITPALHDRVLRRRSMLVVCNGPQAMGGALATGLVADVHALPAGGRIHPGGDGDQWFSRVAAGAMSRTGPAATSFLLEGSPCSSGTALRHGICDVLVPDAQDSVQWIREWVGSRSLLALGSAAALLRSQAGHAGERAEFGRLFAMGSPRRGLTEFLETRAPDFSEMMRVEII